VNRAYSILNVRAVDNTKRVITGTATTPSVDRVGDIVDPLGIKFQNPLPFLWMHDHESPVGTCSFSKPTKDGIEFTAKFVDPASVESPSLKDRLQLAWDSVTTGLVKAVSIGFRPIEYSYMEESNGIRFIESEVYELSAVTIPANSEALIHEIKSIDAAARATAGIKDDPLPEIPSEPPQSAASGKKAVVVRLGAAASKAPFVVRKIHPVRERA
jgi:HK97 family phage prohead protease